MSVVKIRSWLATLLLLALVACGGGNAEDAGTPLLSESGTPAGGGSGANESGTMTIALSSTAISSATPATVTAQLLDNKGAPVAGQVVTFKTSLGLAKTNADTALTDASGNAIVILAPASSTATGADELVASATLGGAPLTAAKGFQIQSTDVTLTTFTSSVATLGAYGQTTLTLGIAGASVGSPVNVSVTSSCVSLGKATLSPSTFTATTPTVDLQLKDNGCGALQAQDKLQAAIVGSASTVSLQLPVSPPTESSLAFIAATPEVIYIKGSGFAETSTLVFEVRDGAGNILPNRVVTLSLQTLSGGMTMEGGTADVTQVSDAAGRVTVRVNSGTIPTPVRVAARLKESPSIATVSSNLSVAVGLPSQLNFSLSQETRNIEGFNIDGTPNGYNIIASDRSGNPVPAGTSINFVTEGGQVESIKQIQLVDNGAGRKVARTTAGFVSADPRPADGRVTVTAYALGEESFVDQNGNNIYDYNPETFTDQNGNGKYDLDEPFVDLNGNGIYDPGEPFQDLGRVFKDRQFDGSYDRTIDEYIPTNIDDAKECISPSATPGATAATNALLAINPSIPSIGSSTCDSKWSGSGKVYVRRAIETVLSTSAARALWADPSKLSSTCSKITLQYGPLPTDTREFIEVARDTWFEGDNQGVLSLLAADANPIRFNPMAAGTTISASTTAKGWTLVVGGSPVPSTTEASGATVAFERDPTVVGAPITANVLVTFRSPSGLGTTYSVLVDTAPLPGAACR